MSLFRKFQGEDGDKSRWLLQVRWLSHLLILSVAINVGLITTFICWVVRDGSGGSGYDYRPVEVRETAAEFHNNKEIFQFFQGLTFDQLLSQLSNMQPAEDGYVYRETN